MGIRLDIRKERAMNLHEAIAATEWMEPPKPVALFARRMRDGTTLLYGRIRGFELPTGINDAVIVIPCPEVRLVEDRTAQFSGHAYDTILESGGKPGSV